MIEPILKELRVLDRQYDDLLRVRIKLTNQGKASCRRQVGGDKTEGAALFGRIRKGETPPDGLVHIALLADQVNAIDHEIKPRRKRLEALAMELPIRTWIEETAGVGALGVARFIANAGDLSDYPSPSHLWSRFGLGRKQHGGQWETQRRTRDKALAITLGYSTRRRSLAYVLWEGTLKVKADSPYRDAYRAKKAEYLERGWTKLHAHKAAHRFATKLLVKHLWRVWRDATG